MNEAISLADAIQIIENFCDWKVELFCLPLTQNGVVLSIESAYKKALQISDDAKFVVINHFYENDLQRLRICRIRDGVVDVIKYPEDLMYEVR